MTGIGMSMFVQCILYSNRIFPQAVRWYTLRMDNDMIIVIEEDYSPKFNVCHYQQNLCYIRLVVKLSNVKV